MTHLITIIVPMYNEEQNVASCVDVLKSQTDQKFEVVFVDDGSTDKTVEKLKYYLESNVEFSYKIIQQKNKGAAGAKRTGIENASSQYIMAYDCDDRLSKNLIEKIYAIHKDQNDVDIIIPNMEIQGENGNWKNLNFYTKDTSLNSIECIKNTLNGWHVHGCFTCKRSIFIKSCIDYEDFNVESSNYINNDEVIARLIFLNSEKIIRSDAVYYYCYNKKSLTKKVNNLSYLMINNAFITDEIFSNKKELESNVKAELVAVIWGAFVYMYKNKLQLENLLVWKKVVGDAIQKLNYLKLIGKLDFKKKSQLTILKLINIF